MQLKKHPDTHSSIKADTCRKIHAHTHIEKAVIISMIHAVVF